MSDIGRREQVFTPSEFAGRVLAWAEPWIPDGPIHLVEPTAGRGALLDAAFRWAERCGRSLTASASEIDPALAEELQSRWAGRAHVRCVDVLDDPPPPCSADLVLCNPPWRRETGSAPLFRRLRATPDGAAMYRRNADLHHFFWLPAMRALRPGGVLVMIVPAGVFDSEAAQPIRSRLLADGVVRVLWRSAGEKVFASVGSETAVVVWTRGHGAASVDVGSVSPVVPGRPDAQPRLTAERFLVDAPRRTSVDNALPLGAAYRIVEGVSTGADRLRRKDATRVSGRVSGEGIYLLRGSEVAALGLHPETVRRWIRPRAGHPDEWVLWLRDGDLPALDEPPRGTETVDPALLRHVTDFAPVLRQRAEVRRNPRRSWYAVAWPRAGFETPGSIRTPKWSRHPAFERLRDGEVPTTEQRVLVPRNDRVAASVDRVVRWLQGEEVASWCAETLKRKGDMLEFYGVWLARLPLPPDILDVDAVEIDGHTWAGRGIAGRKAAL
jgi:hypothetical protein